MGASEDELGALWNDRLGGCCLTSSKQKPEVKTLWVARIKIELGTYYTISMMTMHNVCKEQHIMPQALFHGSMHGDKNAYCTISMTTMYRLRWRRVVYIHEWPVLIGP